MKEKEKQIKIVLYNVGNLQRRNIKYYCAITNIYVKCYSKYIHVFKFLFTKKSSKQNRERKTNENQEKKRLIHKLEWLKLDTSHYDYHEAV